MRRQHVLGQHEGHKHGLREGHRVDGQSGLLGQQHGDQVLGHGGKLGYEQQQLVVQHDG